MFQDNCLIDLLDKLGSAENVSSTWDRTVEYFAGLEFDVINFGIADKTDGSLVGLHSNISDAWMRHYYESGYGKCDPFAQHTVESNADIVCIQENHKKLVSRNSQNWEVMFQELRDLGLKSGLLSPLHNQSSKFAVGLALWSGLDSRGFARLMREKRTQILVGAALAQNHLLQFNGNRNVSDSWFPSPGATQRLTAREQEALLWLCSGFRTDRIAERMNISNATVNFHISSIKRKLNAKTREHAIALAYSLDLME